MVIGIEMLESSSIREYYCEIYKNGNRNTICKHSEISLPSFRADYFINPEWNINITYKKNGWSGRILILFPVVPRMQNNLIIHVTRLTCVYDILSSVKEVIDGIWNSYDGQPVEGDTREIRLMNTDGEVKNFKIIYNKQNYNYAGFWINSADNIAVIYT